MNDGEKLIIRLDTNRYDPQSNLCNILFDTYVVSLKDRRLLDYFSELHVTKVYSISEIRDLLEQCGFEVIGFYEVTPPNFLVRFSISIKSGAPNSSTLFLLLLVRIARATLRQ